MKELSVELNQAIKQLQDMKKKVKKGTFDESDRSIMEKIGARFSFRAAAYKYIKKLS